MTKDEMIDAIIERYKGFENKGRINIFNCCPEIDCDYCPFECRDCTNDIAMSLLDRLIKAEEQSKSLEKTCYKLQQALEEHQETNLEHFRGTVVFDKANGIVHIHLINEWGKSYSDDKGAIDWLLSPYEEPKPKYKLTKFEHDLLQIYVDQECMGNIGHYWELEGLHEKGYFKNIPTNVTLKDILDNCEVVKE